MLIGILAGIGAGAVWGLTFVVARLVEPFTPFDLAIVRCWALGAACVLLVVSGAVRPRRLGSRRVRVALGLGLSGYVFYYVLVAYAVQLAGPILPPLIIGLLPVLMALVGNWRGRDVRWLALAWPLLAIGAGLSIVNGAALGAVETVAGRAELALGVALSIGAVGLWLCYGIVNAAVMRSPDAPEALPWTAVQGVGAALGTLPLVPLAWPSSGFHQFSLQSPEAVRLVVWAAVLGLGSSGLATWWWVLASRRLPLTLSAQLIVSETLFGLLYGFLLERRWPSLAEGVGMVLMLGGVMLAIRIFLMPRGSVPVVAARV